jgi:hypothetical protein
MSKNLKFLISERPNPDLNEATDGRSQILRGGKEAD